MPSDPTATADAQAQLEQERDALRAQLAELGFADGSTGLEYDSNFADSSQVTAERGEAEAIATKLRDALDEVEHALAKLGTSTYGDCEDCGNPIGEARLEA